MQKLLSIAKMNIQQTEINIKSASIVEKQANLMSTIQSPFLSGENYRTTNRICI